MFVKALYILVLPVIISIMLAACGPRQFSDGRYDKDVEKTNLLNDSWSESDMQEAVKTLVTSASKHPVVANSTRPPVVVITGLQNKTSEHIDTQNVTDMIRVELMKNGKLSFVDKAAREDIAEEYDYQASGAVNNPTRKRTGSQIGADYILNGRLDSIVQKVGSKKTVYYKVTLNMTNLKTGIIVWSDYKQIRKLFKKKRVGL